MAIDGSEKYRVGDMLDTAGLMLYYTNEYGDGQTVERTFTVADYLAALVDPESGQEENYVN